MKKTRKELKGKTVAELQKEVGTLRGEIAKLTLEKKVKPQKNTNMVMQKRREIARMKTMITVLQQA